MGPIPEKPEVPVSWLTAVEVLIGVLLIIWVIWTAGEFKKQ